MNDLIYRLLGYKRKYEDKKGTILYIKSGKTAEDSNDNRLAVLKKFGPRRVLNKTNLKTGKPHKLFTGAFLKAKIIKVTLKKGQ